MSDARFAVVLTMPKRHPPLQVRITFEPTRLATECLARAYESFVPVKRRSLEANGERPVRGDQPIEAKKRRISS